MENLRGGEGWGESGNGMLYTSPPGIQMLKRCFQSRHSRDWGIILLGYKNVDTRSCCRQTPLCANVSLPVDFRVALRIFILGAISNEILWSFSPQVETLYLNFETEFVDLWSDVG